MRLWTRCIANRNRNVKIKSGPIFQHAFFLGEKINNTGKEAAVLSLATSVNGKAATLLFWYRL